MREIWMMQPRFEKRVGSTPFSLAEQPRFRAGFDFLRLRADVQEVALELADWWQEFSMADEQTRADLVEQARSQQQSKPKTRTRRVSKPKLDTAAPEAASSEVQGSESEGEASPVKKRRRRRRKPAGGVAGEGGSEG